MLRRKNAKPDKETREKSNELDKDFDKEMRTAWAAICAAGVVSLPSAQYKIRIFTGDPEITA